MIITHKDEGPLILSSIFLTFWYKNLNGATQKRGRSEYAPAPPGAL